MAGSSLLVRALEGDDAPGIDGPTVTTPTPTPESDYLLPDERWAPEVHIEDGMAVMPLTFPDGTSAELQYEPDVHLDELSVSPHSYIDGPDGCGFTVTATRYDPAVGWIQGGVPPLFEHTRPDGVTVGLWEGHRSNRPYDYLVFPFDDWYVIVGCRVGRDGPDPDLLRTWIEGLDGHRTQDGLIVLESRDPIEVHPWSDVRSSPAIMIQGDDLIIELRATEGCASAPSDLSVGDEVAQWCLDPNAGIYVYANAWSPEAKDRLALFIATAQIRVTS